MDYVVTLYHDTATDAAADSKGWYVRASDCPDPVTYARARLSAYWQTATVDGGELVTEYPEPGIPMESFVGAEPLVRWYVGPDWADTP